MNIIELAKEAGFDQEYLENPNCDCDECNFLRPPVVRFAALVAANEREACAKVCEAKQSYNAMHANTDFAAAIRGLK